MALSTLAAPAQGPAPAHCAVNPGEGDPQYIGGYGSRDGGRLPERRWPHSYHFFRIRCGLTMFTMGVVALPDPMRPDNVHNGCCGVASRRILGQTVQAPAQLAAECVCHRRRFHSTCAAASSQQDIIHDVSGMCIVPRAPPTEKTCVSTRCSAHRTGRITGWSPAVGF